MSVCTDNNNSFFARNDIDVSLDFSTSNVQSDLVQMLRERKTAFFGTTSHDGCLNDLNVLCRLMFIRTQNVLLFLDSFCFQNLF